MKFQAIHQNGFVIAERATGWANFWNEIVDISIQGEESIWTFLLNKKPVSFDEMREACKDARIASKAKKELTHKRVRISVGATCLPNTYRSIWVKK